MTTESLAPDPTPDDAYCGIILEDTSFSEPLRERVARRIAAFHAFEQAEVPVMPYISAWRVDEKIIWYEFASSRLTRLLGCRPPETAAAFREAVIQHHLYKFVDSAPAIKEQILDREHMNGSAKKLRDLRRKTGVADAVYKLVLPDGKTAWLKDRATVETHDQDRICLSFGCLVDVTKEMTQKDQLSEDNVVMSRDTGLLVEAERNEALGQISAQVFHEIRNPIVAIGGLAKRILNKGQDASLRMYSEVIAREAGRLEQVLNNLFQFTRAEKPKRRPVAPEQVAKNAMVLLREELEKNRIKLLFAPSDGLPSLRVDIRLMEEALVHILKNAIEALPEEGRIELTLRHDGHSVFFIVKDQGLGIRVNHQNRITEPFFTTKVSGTGFGLSLAKKYIELHQGTLQIISTVASGTKVVVKIPVAMDDTAPSGDRSDRITDRNRGALAAKKTHDNKENPMSEFSNVTVIKKANVYFDGKVTSRSVLFADGSKKTLGIMLPGEYEFGTADPEVMEIMAGELEVLLPGESEWRQVRGGESFNVPGNAKFGLRIKTLTDYCCSFVK